MFNPHPPLSGFPFILLSVALASEILSFFWQQENCRKFALNCLWVACLVSPITYFSGYWGAEYANQSFSISEDVIANHQAWAKFYLISLVSTLLFSILSREYKTRLLRALFLLCLALSFSLASFTALKGGRLVFEHGAGVSAEIE